MFCYIQYSLKEKFMILYDFINDDSSSAIYYNIHIFILLNVLRPLFCALTLG